MTEEKKAESESEKTITPKVRCRVRHIESNTTGWLSIVTDSRVRVVWDDDHAPTNFTTEDFASEFEYLTDATALIDAAKAEIEANSVCSNESGPKSGEMWENHGQRYLVLRSDDRNVEFAKDAPGASKETLKTMIFIREFQKVKEAVPSLEDNVKRIADALEKIGNVLVRMQSRSWGRDD